MNAFNLTISGNPPSLNHYRKQRVIAGRVSWYMGAEAKAWFAEFAALAAGAQLRGTRFALTFRVYMGTLRRYDVDNAAKIIGDALTKTGVIPDDSMIYELHAHKLLDRECPRTEIHVEAMA